MKIRTIANNVFVVLFLLSCKFWGEFLNWFEDREILERIAPFKNNKDKNGTTLLIMVAA